MMISRECDVPRGGHAVFRAVGVLGLGLSLLSLMACGDADAGGADVDAGSAGTPVTFAALQDASLSLATFDGDTVPLADGRWQNPVGREWVELLPEYTGSADVDGDGITEQVGLLRLFHVQYGEVYGLYSAGPGAGGPVIEADQPILTLFDLESFEVVDNRIQLRVVRTGARGVRRRELLTYAIVAGAWTLQSQRSLRDSTAS